MNNKILFSLIFLLVLAPIIYAQPPFQQEDTIFTEGYIIKIPPINVIKHNENLELSFHVYNISNGVPIGNAEATCDIHLYNSSGHTIFQGINIINDADKGIINDWEIQILKGNFTQAGNYAYLIQCNSTLFGGFQSVGFEVTADGLQYNQPRAITYIAFLIILIFLFLIVVAAIPLLPHGNIKNEIGDLLSINYLKFLTFILYPLAWFLLIAVMFTSANIGIATNIRLFGDLFMAFYTIMIRITPVFLLVWAMWLLVNMFKDRELKKLLDRGVDMWLHRSWLKKSQEQ